nr:myosin-6-like isoform X2 [Tanacetum cinerariifolium]
MREQSQEKEELIQKEHEVGKKEIKQARADNDISSKEIVERLTVENEKLKMLLSELSNEVGFLVKNMSFDALLESLLSTTKPFPQSAGYRILAS